MRFLIFSIFIFIGSTSLAQHLDGYTTKSKKAIKDYEEANQFINRRQFPEAIQLLQKAVAKDNDFLEAHLRLAFCYNLLRDNDKQKYHLEQVVRISPRNPRYINVYYTLAAVYFGDGEYEKAAQSLQTFESFNSTSAKLAPLVKKLDANLQFAMEGIKHPLDIHPVPLPPVINAFALQYFPVLTADENTIFYTRRNGFSFSDDEDIVMSKRDSTGQWTTPISISPNINSDFNEGTCTISADGRILIFTTCEGRKGYGSCDLYISTRIGDSWSDPKNLGPNINTRAWESQPSLSADGRTLYFISDRGDGIGKRDIWMSEVDEEGKWKKAWNLGPQVNTSDEEVSPFIHVNGTSLFFASKGYPGFGGFDIYKTEKTSDGWSKPKNIGYPINNHNDQVSLFISANGKTGYYSYEEHLPEGKSKSELYDFTFPKGHLLVRETHYVKGHVYDEETKKPLEATVELHDLEAKKVLNVFKSDPLTGEYFSVLNQGGKYALYVESPGYLFESRYFNYADSISNNVIIDFYLKPIKKGLSTALNNIFFDFDKYDLKDESVTELQKMIDFFENNPDVKVEIAGHTDNKGGNAYNQKLSELRAKAVYDYLVAHGVDPARISYRGYGETKPLLPNTSEANMEKNRRIEFVIK